jgi:hypothetical protein
MVCRGLDQDLLDVEEDILLGGGGDQDPNAKVWSVAMRKMEGGGEMGVWTRWGTNLLEEESPDAHVR